MIRAKACAPTRSCRALRITLPALVLLVCLVPVTPTAAAPQMYIASYGNDKIIRSNLDGTGSADLTNPGGLLNGPEGLALDLAGGKMYIASRGNHKVVRANLDGTGGLDLGNLNGSLNEPWAIALDPTYLQFMPVLIR